MTQPTKPVSVEKFIPPSDIQALRQRVVELNDLVEAALEFADEGWAYASEYFREKWGYEEQRAGLLDRLGNGTLPIGNKDITDE